MVNYELDNLGKEEYKKIGKRIKEIRSRLGYTQEVFAQILDCNERTYGGYERGERRQPLWLLKKIAKLSNVPIDHIIGIQPKEEKIAEAYPVEKRIPVPVYGEVRAGEPMFAREEVLGYEFLSPEDVRGGEYFFLKVKGDSMINARICEGDFVLVRRQPVLENGKIGVVLIGDEATIKRFYRQGNLAILKPENPAYEPIVVPLRDVVIIGEIVEAKIKFN